MGRRAMGILAQTAIHKNRKAREFVVSYLAEMRTHNAHTSYYPKIERKHRKRKAKDERRKSIEKKRGMKEFSGSRRFTVYIASQSRPTLNLNDFIVSCQLYSTRL